MISSNESQQHLFRTSDLNLASAMLARGFTFKGFEHEPGGSTILLDSEIVIRGKTITAHAFKEEYETGKAKLDPFQVLNLRDDLQGKRDAERMANGFD